MAERKKRIGDRPDGYILKEEVPAMNRAIGYLYGNRTDCECYFKLDINLRHMEEYLARKNEGLTKDKYNYFHVILAGMVKCFVLRPVINRFFAGNRMYQRNHISVAFVVKKRFDDKAEEGLAYQCYDKNDNIDTLRESILKEIYQCRREDIKDNSNDMMDKVMSLPHWLVKPFMSLVKKLDKNGKVPYSLIKTDPDYASIFVSNLGSIGLDCIYHHLNNWGTNSVFAVIGKKHYEPEWDENGNCTVNPTITLGFTLDERIGDGFYFAKTLKLLKAILENPEVLEQPFETPVEF